MTRRLIPWTTTGLLVLACSSGETPSDDNGTAGKGTTSAAGTLGTAGSSSGSAGKATAGAGGSAGTGAPMGGSAGTSMPSAGRSGAGAAGSPGGAGPIGGAGGATPTAGTTSNAGTPGAGAGAGGAGSAGMAGGPAGGDSSGGAPAGGMGGMGGSGSSTKGYTCNLVIGIDSTSEWYTGGFEDQVPNDKWEIIYHHPGYVENWADTNDEVWTLAPTSACTMNSTNPDRVIFNIYSETLTEKDTLVTALNKAITNFKNKYSRLQRIDILTMTRAPNNMPCVQGNNGSIVQQYVDDATQMVVSAGPPPVVASPPFFAPDCDVFDSSGGPHFSTAGMPIVAKIYGDYYLAEP